MDFTVSVLVDKICSTEVIRTLLACVLLLTLHVFFLFGLLQGVLIAVSYLAGLYIFHFSIRHVPNINGILSSVTRVILQKCWPNLPEGQDSEPKKTENLRVPMEIDNALDQFMNRLVNHYLSHWYSNISTDQDFPHEIRIIIQHAVSNCYRRLSKVKMDDFMFEKALPICLNHVHSYEKLKTEPDVSDLHIAVHSRTAELLYLQNLSKTIMKYVVRDSELRCKPFSILLREILTRNVFLALSDTVCNPNISNPILLNYLRGHYNFLSTESSEDVEKVPLLDKFVSTVKSQPLHACLRPDICTIFREDDLKEAFMRYLRSKNTDHMLQFCIDIEIFKDKLSQPNLDSEELDNLYRDAWDLYSVYFSNYSPNCIQFENDYASTLRKALSKDVLKLRNTRTLSDAYDYVYGQLENYCSDFYSSNEFYSWLYGRFESSELARSNEMLSLGDEMTALGSSLEHKTGFELGNKLNIIKEVLKPNQILEGQVQETLDADTSMELGEDIQMVVPSNERNMNTWKISIPTVGSRVDPITNRPYTVFVIHTQTEAGEDWVVERRPNDFYSLDVKLTEFHGSFRDAQLPPRKLMTSRTECSQMYEDYLNKLVKISALKSSELLSTFLSSIEDFEEEEISLGKLFRKSVVPTLRKERGQNLEAFISGYVSSCKITKYEWKDVGEVKKPKKQSSKKRVFENNFDVNPDVSQQIFYTRTPPPPNDTFFEKPSASLLYLGMRMYNVRDGIVKFLLALQSFFGGVVDQLIGHFLRRSFSRILTITNVAYMINLTEKAIFESKSKYDAEEIKLGLTETLDSLKSSWLHPLYVLLYENLQDAKLNKQLYYQLMDAVIQELFPELNEIDRS